MFDGLKISESDYDWKKYPVIHFDFSAGDTRDAKSFAQWLDYMMASVYALEYGVKLSKRASVQTNFDRLILKVSETSKCVVLVDEYDKPLSDNVFTGKAEEIREVIRDISMDARFSPIRYTQQEFEQNFSEHIDAGSAKVGIDRKKYMEMLKSKYDGYRFAPDCETLYNPVSIGMFFFKGGAAFDSFWADTGGNTKLIVDAARRSNFNIADDLKRPIAKTMVSGYDVVEMASAGTSPDLVKSLLYQSGYLAIADSLSAGQAFTLDFPNAEVREAFSANLVSAYIGERAGMVFLLTRFFRFSRKGKRMRRWKR